MLYQFLGHGTKMVNQEKCGENHLEDLGIDTNINKMDLREIWWEGMD
jgi:hypothetical protein